MSHDDPARVHEIILEILDAGDSFRLGYAAVLQAPRDIPPPDTKIAPVLITAYDGDPMQAHIDRLGPMPAGWEARKVRTPADQQAASLAFLQTLPATRWRAECRWPSGISGDPHRRVRRPDPLAAGSG